MRPMSLALLVVIILGMAAISFAGDCGDVNGPGTVNALDITYLINFLYKHGPAPNPLQSGDVNNSGTVNALDITFLINYLYKHGPAPYCLPVLSTAAVSILTETTAGCGGSITSDGGASVTARGVCWSTNPIPTVADNLTTDGAGTGSFTSSITGLTAGTTYYLRAYATNSVGTGYGDAQTFIAGTVTDIDGNVYRIVTIGFQVWMVENLKVMHYRNGDAIPNVTDGPTWAGLTTGAYCEYDNDVNNVATYGRLYNLLAVNDSRNIAPAGWHVASTPEWQQLVTYLGSWAIAGGKMKEAGTAHWQSPNTGATNESGFSALPGGLRGYGSYALIGSFAYFWSSEGLGYVGYWYLRSDDSVAYGPYTTSEVWGLSVRCVKDVVWGL